MSTEDNPSQLPSAFLPTIARSRLDVKSLQETLARLQSCLNGPADLESLELTLSQDWLARLLALSYKDEDEELSSEISDTAGALLGRLMGGADNSVTASDLSIPDSKANSSNRVFRFPAPLLPGGQAEIILSESQLGDDVHATGFTTWSSAVHLSRRLLAAPSAYFPSSSQSIGSATSRSPLRILELGSGTGLAGLASIVALGSLSIPAHVVLSDYDDATLAALRRNLDINRTPAGVTHEVRKLAWERAGQNTFIQREGEFDLVLGADIVYEREHPALIHAVVERLLHARGVFHLLVPRRHTHTAELEMLESRFEARDLLPALCIVQQEDLESDDDAPTQSLPRQRKQTSHGSTSHRYYRIEWR